MQLKYSKFHLNDKLYYENSEIYTNDSLMVWKGEKSSLIFD